MFNSKSNLKIISVFIFQFLFLNFVFPCSSFQLKTSSNSYQAKNYDWTFGDALIVYNPAHLQKISLTLMGTQKKVQWVSQHSSLTFNQYGLDFPNGGINDAGLSVEVLWLDSSIYPLADSKAVLNELQWIQYVLDTQKTAQGAAETLKEIRIEPVYAKVHYFLCDKSKTCRTVEYINGKAFSGKYQNLDYQAITNSTYNQSTKYLSQFKNFGGTKDVVWNTYASLDRYVRINEKLRTFDGKDPITYAFSTLDTVQKENNGIATSTQWQIVYDKKNLKTFFKTHFGNPDIATVSLNSFPKNCDKRYYFDLDNKTRGDLDNQFAPLTFEINYAHVKKTLKKVMPAAPEEMIKAIAGAPFQFVCQE